MSRVYEVPQSPPPWPPSLLLKPHIPIGAISRLSLFHEGITDPVPAFLEFFPDFALWAEPQGIHIGVTECPDASSNLWLVAYSDALETVLQFQDHWRPFLARHLWLFARRSHRHPKIVMVLPRLAHMEDVQNFFPVTLRLRNGVSDDTLDNWCRVATNPAALIIHQRDITLLRLRTEADAVLARLSGF